MSVKQYRKTPAVTEAIEYTVTNREEIIEWANGRAEQKGGFLLLQTPDGIEKVDPGDYVLRHAPGAYSKLNPILFENTYEEIDD